jgi:hypothetical protein
MPPSGFFTNGKIALGQGKRTACKAHALPSVECEFHAPIREEKDSTTS